MWRHKAKTTTWGCTLKNQPNATSVKVRPSGCFCSVDLLHNPMTTVIIVNTNIALMIEYMTWIIYQKSDILNESCSRQYCRCRTVDVASVQSHDSCISQLRRAAAMEPIHMTVVFLLLWCEQQCLSGP